MKKPIISLSLMALAISGQGWATSPYDSPYGVQWNFMIGGSGNDTAGSTDIDVTDDGTIFVSNRTSNNDTWGSGSTNSVNSGMGAISPLGQLVYGTTLSSLPGMISPGQNYVAGVATHENTAYFAIYGGQGQFWTGEDGKDNARAMVWSLDPSGLGSIANRHSLSKFSDNGGTLRTDTLQPTTTGLTPPEGQNRIQASAFRGSTGDMVLVMDMVAGDFSEEDDYEGYGLRNSGTANAYLPGIGVYNFNTNTLDGPAKQPLLTYSGEVGSNFGTYTAAAIDQTTGTYCGAGSSHARNESSSDAFDPDGSGPADPIPISGPSAIGTAYDSSHNLLYAVVWDTPGADVLNFISPTNDGSGSIFWAGEKEDDCYLELRDLNGDIVWSDSFDQSPAVDEVVGVERIAGVSINANGDLLVSGYFENGGANATNPRQDAYDNFLRKYEKTGPNAYSLQWSTTVGAAGARDLMSAASYGSSDQTVYLVSDAFADVPNTTGHVYAGGSDLLVRKMVAGDFNDDGLVDFVNDVQTAGDATKPGPLTGDDTYDFDGDGDSTFPEDVNFFITEIMDRLVGDVAQDAAVTDVDNGDIGKLIGTTGTGSLYIDGDLDFDGDVDGDDLTGLVEDYTGAVSVGRYTAGTVGTTLTYRPADGSVILAADSAAGGIITSFQLENAEGTFTPVNYSGPTGGSFGGTLEDVSESVIADTDLTLTGATGKIDLGGILPTGMDFSQLQAFLTTAVYTGEPGSGQMQFDLLLDLQPTDYPTWALGFPTLSDSDPNLDFEGDGLASILEYVLGGNPTIDDSIMLSPTVTSTGTGLEYVFRRSDIAAADTDIAITVEYGSDLVGWTSAEDAVDGVVFTPTDDFYDEGIDRVAVTLPAALVSEGKMFVRLKVTQVEG